MSIGNRILISRRARASESQLGSAVSAAALWRGLIRPRFGGQRLLVRPRGGAGVVREGVEAHDNAAEVLLESDLVHGRSPARRILRQRGSKQRAAGEAIARADKTRRGAAKAGDQPLEADVV